MLPSPLSAAIATLDSWVDRYLTERQNAVNISEPLYQYTNASGLQGIIESEQLWFTDYRYLNDPTEFKHGLRLVSDALTECSAKNTDRRVGLVLDLMHKTLTHENFNAQFSFFVSSFTRSSDDLGQWRTYGDNGRGFAIGFSRRMFDIVESAPESAIEKIILDSVVYDHLEAREMHQSVIDAALGIFLDAADQNARLLHDDDIRRAFIVEWAMTVAVPLISNSLVTKHKAYKNECEVRQMIIGMSDIIAPEIKTRIRGSECVPYVSPSWKIRAPDMIAEIIVGPASPQNSEDAVRSLLSRYGLTGTLVRRSDIPYRPT